jgi:uncharacterized protein (UPF0303 family)
MDSKMKMGLTRDMVTENKLTCAIEFPILQNHLFASGSSGFACERFNFGVRRRVAVLHNNDACTAQDKLS